VNTALLGSRDQMCRHPDVMKLSSNALKTSRCREKVKAKRCEYYSRVAGISVSKFPDSKIKFFIETAKSATFQENILDIEDLIQLADNFHSCAYYLARESIERSDIIFVPYNYLIDPTTRKAQGVALANSILLIDEAHNIESCATDAFSFSLSSLDFERAIKDIFTASSLPASTDANTSLSNASSGYDFDGTKRSFSVLQSKLEELFASFSTLTLIKDGSFLADLFLKAEVF
jgi:regulator of telomere elongation helicase 1